MYGAGSGFRFYSACIPIPMKALIKRLAGKLLFNVKKATGFPAVRIDEGKVQEMFVLKRGDHRIDVSLRHQVICHNPPCLSVWISVEEALAFGEGTLEACVFSGAHLLAEMTVQPVHQVMDDDHRLVVLQVMQARNFQIGAWHQELIRWYFRNKNSVFEDKFYAAAYSYPRKVIAVSYQEEGHYNIFPMDFQCCLDDRRLYVLGLRTTNITLNKMIASKRVVIGDTDTAALETIYALGSHHGSNPPPLYRLSFKTQPSERFGFPVPDFSASYLEVELVSHYQLGSHTMLVGKIVHMVERRKRTSSIYHVHYFQSLRSHYSPA